MFLLLREDRASATGWVPVDKLKTLAQAEAKARTRELMMRWQYSNDNPDRQYHCIEEILK